MFIDTHCHLSSEFYSDIPEVILEDEKAGMSQIIASFCEIDTVDDVCTFIDNYNIVYATIGFHPDQASKYTDADLLKLRELCLKYKKIVGIGEIGLDYHYPINETEKNNQKDIFISQICLAKKLNLPIVIHSRDADKDTFDILCQYAQDMKVYLHCYSGSYEMAKEYIKKIPNIHFGVGGIVTFKNAKKLVEVVEKIDLKYFLTETDAPYLTPVPFRGKQNEPSYLIYVINKISELKNMNEVKVEEILFENAREFFDL